MCILEMDDCYITIFIVIKYMFVLGFIQVCTKKMFVLVGVLDDKSWLNWGLVCIGGCIEFVLGLY